MRASEILRSIADMIDKTDPAAGAATPSPNQAKLTVVSKPAEPEPDHDPCPDMTVNTMVSPLQQKMELLKKAVGVDSIFDAGDEQPDELAVMRQNAGIKPVVAFAAGADLEDDQIYDGPADSAGR